MKKENKELLTIFSWLEEYSTIKIKQKDGLAKLNLKDVLNDKNAELKIDHIPISMVRNYFNYEIKRGSEEGNNNKEQEREEGMKFINFSEECIEKIEEPTFDIFKLEKEVGEENILSTVSCYIFTTMGFYSIVRYDKFEMFIHEVAKGYNRNNPYHNVKN